MLTEEQKKKITAFAEKYVAKNDPFHQMKHICIVAKDALMLAEKEHGDADVCWTAAMLHDIVKSEPGDHGIEGSKIAGKFLLELGLDKGFVEKVRDAIYWHNKGFSDGPIERKITWDADKFDSMNINGFKERMILAYQWEFKDKKVVLEKVAKDYPFYAALFRTETGKAEVKKHQKEIEEYIAKLKAENSF